MNKHKKGRNKMKKKNDFKKNPNLAEVLILTKEKTQESLIESLEKAGFLVYQKPRFVYIKQ